MLDLLTVPALTIAVSIDHAGPLYRVHDSGGACLATATMSDVSLDGVIRRWFGDAARYPFTAEVLDAGGGVVLTFEKARSSSLRGALRITARLADGSVIGAVRARWPMSRRIQLFEAGGALIASAAVGRYTQGFDVVAEPGRSQQLASSALDTAPPRMPDAAGTPTRSFRVTFADGAPVLVRALTIAYVITNDLRLFPKGRLV